MKTSRIIAALLACLGFSGCEDIGGGRLEYGTPNASFEVKGRVTDEAGDAIRDIKIVVRDDDSNRTEGEVGVGITDARGNYRVIGDWFGGSDLTVAAEDIDGDKNGGRLGPQQPELKIENGDYVGGDGWYRGSVTKTADFTLIPEGNENE